MRRIESHLDCLNFPHSDDMGAAQTGSSGGERSQWSQTYAYVRAGASARACACGKGFHFLHFVTLGFFSSMLEWPRQSCA